MTPVQMIIVGLITAAFSIFFLTLMAVWIWTRGWAPRTEVQAVQAPQPATGQAPAQVRMAA